MVTIQEAQTPQNLRTRRGLMFTALPAIAIITVLGALLAIQHRDASVDDRLDEAVGIARAAAGNASRFVEDQLAILAAVARSPTVRRGDYGPMRDYFVDVRRNGRFSSGITYIAMDGRTRASTVQPLGSQPLDVNDRPYVRAAIDGDEAVSDVLIGKVRSLPILAFATPTSTLNGRRSGLVAGSVALDQVDAGLRRLLVTPGAGETLVDSEDNVIVDARPVRELRRPDSAYPIAAMRRRGSGALDDVRTDAGRRLVGYARVPATGWMVITDRSYGDVMGTLDTALWAEIAALGMLGLLGVFGTFAFARRLDRLDRARGAALDEQRTIALELQRSMLPDLPRIDGIDIDAGYVPASGEMSVGGDWFDVIDMGDGRVAVSVGDVAGHGLRSAVVMGQLRSATRSLALARGTPAEALTQLDRFISTLSGRPLATVVYATFERATGVLRFAAAGHPPPLLVRADGSTEFLEGGRSPLLGVDAVERPEGEVHLGPGETLVIYTDGLVERPDAPIDAGLAALARRVAAGERASELLAGVEEPRRDDAAVLCLTAQPSSVAS